MENWGRLGAYLGFEVQVQSGQKLRGLRGGEKERGCEWVCGRLGRFSSYLGLEVEV